MFDYSRKVRLPVHLRFWLPLILGLAFGLRAALALVHPFWHPGSPDHPFTYPDSADYHALALALFHHQPYQVGGLMANRMPGYPLLLAAIYALSGASIIVALFVQAILGTLVVLFTYLLAKRISQPVALVAAALVAFDPLTVGFTASLLSETPFTLCLLVTLWLCIRLVEVNYSGGRLRLIRWMFLGLLLGISVYLRASALWLSIPLCAAVMFLKNPRNRSVLVLNLRGVALALLVLFALLSPWLIRNYSLFHSGFFRLTTLEGISLYEAVYPDADGGPKQDVIPLPPEMRSLNEAQRNDEWSRRAWMYIRSDPARIARLALIKFGRTWSPTFNAREMRVQALQWVMALWYIPLFILGLVGLGGLMPGHVRIILVVPILYFSLLHSLFLGSIRYRVPLMPLVCIFAAIGLCKLVKRLRPAKPSQAVSV